VTLSVHLHPAFYLFHAIPLHWRSKSSTLHWQLKNDEEAIEERYSFRVCFLAMAGYILYLYASGIHKYQLSQLKIWTHE
jgi:hypothetical protein